MIAKPLDVKITDVKTAHLKWNIKWGCTELQILSLKDVLEFTEIRMYHLQYLKNNHIFSYNYPLELPCDQEKRFGHLKAW